ncbi:hypothetical protein AN396_00885 [Candidatus Epulonipiscium fishelsonii]|uniref:Uncharacterized protein n=1 Tax=Candidatus Epulonipiscium fishelsonii TaxID=77094 RepID=A0ACC8XDF9_9FIRM|nr:hypothetical protein AN396_00885 [Epulopiscium sp. SCG-B11WGA-EpuloA1]
MLIVIDAGHGGKDPGAIGVTGLYEKTVNLDIALKLAKKLESVGVNTLLTRKTNVYLTLGDRARLANDNHANYFISIHANSSNTKTANGVETLIYKPNGISEEFAQSVQLNLVEATGLVDRGIKLADLSVLRNTVMPAILVEVGFLSNEKEEALLRQDSFLEIIAQGLFNGIINFLEMETTRKPEVKPTISVVENQHWGQVAIDNLINLGLLASNKDPDAYVTWAEFATVISRLVENK